MTRIKCAMVCGILLALMVPAAQAQRNAWRQATDAELASVLPARAPVEKEHIETEMRTASGIVNGRGHFIAGVVLLTAGYSADGKYSHYLLVQAPVKIGGVALKPGEYVFGRGAERAFSCGHDGRTGGDDGGAPAGRIKPHHQFAHLAAEGQGGDSDW